MSETKASQLNPARLRALRARAHPLEPVVLVGDKGLTGAVLAEIERALGAHELIKIRAAGERAERTQMLGRICAATGAAAVQHIGRVLVVYREKPPGPKPKGNVRRGSRTASPRRAPARPPGPRRTSRSARARSAS